MNQILANNFNYESDKNSIVHNKKFKLLFFFSLFVILICIILYFFIQYNARKKEKLSSNLVERFSIQNLYGTNLNYNVEKLNTNIEEEPFVIGLLKIDKINLMYPILSNSSEELLKISPCRFYGPMPNEIGNLCIAGHNYTNQTHFGKLTSLVNEDLIQIYDLNGGYIDYKIYSIKETLANDVSCTNQNTNNLREVTLVTCNTIRGNRIVVKAKENR